MDKGLFIHILVQLEDIESLIHLFRCDGSFDFHEKSEQSGYMKMKKYGKGNTC